MRAIVGLLALLVVLAAIGLAAKRQLQAADAGAVSRAAQASAQAGGLASGEASAPAASAPGDLAGIERDVRNRAAEAVQQGAKRNEAADN